MSSKNMPSNSDATAAIESLENLFKAKIKLQDAQTEAAPMQDMTGLLFGPDPLDEEQKTTLRNGLKSLRKLLESHNAYSEAMQQAEAARSIVHQLLGMPEPEPVNGKANQKAAEPQPTEAKKK